jgi:hypothetical protein
MPVHEPVAKHGTAVVPHHPELAACNILMDNDCHFKYAGHAQADSNTELDKVVQWLLTEMFQAPVLTLTKVCS